MFNSKQQKYSQKMFKTAHMQIDQEKYKLSETFWRWNVEKTQEF